MGFFDRMRGKNNNSSQQGSSSTAKDRLKMVLTHDRIKVSPEKMKEMRSEIIAIITKYIPEIDTDSVEIALEQSDRYQNKLVAEIPFTKERSRVPDDNDGNDDLSDFEDTSENSVDEESAISEDDEENMTDDDTIDSKANTDND